MREEETLSMLEGLTSILVCLEVAEEEVPSSPVVPIPSSPVVQAGPPPAVAAAASAVEAAAVVVVAAALVAVQATPIPSVLSFPSLAPVAVPTPTPTPTLLDPRASHSRPGTHSAAASSLLPRAPVRQEAQGRLASPRGAPLLFPTQALGLDPSSSPTLELVEELLSFLMVELEASLYLKT